MPRPSPPTITRIDPAYPMLWRDVDTVQFGLDAKLVVPLTGPWVEPLLQSMRDGIRRGSFDVVAHSAGAPRDAARELLAALKPVLRTEPRSRPSLWLESMNMADSRVAARMEAALVDEGYRTTQRAAAGSVGVVLVHGAVSARQLAGYLADDVPHLPVAFEPGGATVGPLIVPGRTPCLACQEAHERDRDPSWPGLHAQLVGATGHRISASDAAEAAGTVARVLAETGETARTTQVRITPDGRRVRRGMRFHEECLCRDRWSRSPAGNATAPAPLDLPRAPTTRPAFARPA